MPELKNLYVFIHTFEIRINESKNIFEYMKKEKNIPYIKTIRGDETETILEINPNKYYGRKLKSITEFNKVLELILSELKIVDYYISRLDVALDSVTEFDESYKVNSFIIDLDSTRLNVNNTFKTTHKSGAKRQYILKDSNYQHAFYDKKAESHGRDDAFSRTEIRYIKNIDNERIKAELSIDKTIYNLSHIINEFNNTVEEITNNLYKLYVSETSKNASNSVSSFTEFIVRHEDMIKAKKILTGLYKKCMSGSCASWLNKYRKSKNIELPLKGDIQSRLNEYKKALIYYKNH